METVMDVVVGSWEDYHQQKYCYEFSKKDSILYEKGRKLVDVLGLGGLWKGYFAALYYVLKALDDARKGD